MPTRTFSFVDVDVRWAAVAPHRSRLVGLARSRGAGDRSEDVAHTAMMRAVERSNLRVEDPWPYLATIVVNLCRDLHARDDRERRLSAHRGLLPRARDATERIHDLDEARNAAAVLRADLSRELLRDCYRLALGHATYHQLASERQESEPKVRAEVRRAYLRVRAIVSQWRRGQ